MKHAVVAKAWVDLCYATNQQPVQKSHEFARLRTQVHLQVQLVLHHLDSQDVMMKIHPTTLLSNTTVVCICGSCPPLELLHFLPKKCQSTMSINITGHHRSHHLHIHLDHHLRSVEQAGQHAWPHHCYQMKECIHYSPFQVFASCDVTVDPPVAYRQGLTSNK